MNKVTILILLSAWHIVYADEAKIETVFNTDKLYVKKISSHVVVDGKYLHSTFTKNNAELYTLNGSALNKPLVIRQWAYRPKIPISANRPEIAHRFTLINDKQIIVDQYSGQYGFYECRVYDLKSQKLTTPKQCIKTDYLLAWYKKIDRSMYLVWGSAEGTQDFAIAHYTPEQGQTNYLYADTADAGVNSEKFQYVKGVVYFTSSCDLIDEYRRIHKKMPGKKTNRFKCPMFADRYDKQHMFKWSKSNGLEYDR